MYLGGTQYLTITCFLTLVLLCLLEYQSKNKEERERKVCGVCVKCMHTEEPKNLTHRKKIEASQKEYRID